MTEVYLRPRGGLAPRLLQDMRSEARLDGHRIIVGIVQVVRSCCRSKDAPPAYGPLKLRLTALLATGRP